MPSSITLTVSHLAQSTSFFLSALQPLGYIYRGHACSSTIAFGPVDITIPPDFWLTQSTPAVPAGAAHVAFPAKSRQAVQDFFHAALIAGATVHGEPSLRDSHGYYSAAIIDFDGNSIEAVYRPVEVSRHAAHNDACSAVSNSSRSKALSADSHTPSTAMKASNVVAKQSVPDTPPAREPTKGDALDTILAQARSAADVARQLVDSVRPNLSSSTSAPVVPSQGAVHNKDAFAKAGDATNTVMGTLLGVAAGAAMTYAITSRNSSSSPSSDGSSHDRKSKDPRPGLARSATVPHFHQKAFQGRSTPGHGNYIALHDNDKHTTVSSSVIKPDARSRRRSSFDSGIGPSPPSSTSTVQSSRKSRQRMIEAPPPPSAYKGPSGAIEAATKPRSRSQTRSSTDPDTRHHRSRSESRSRHSSSNNKQHHHRHDSGYSEAGYQTVLHVTTHQAYGTATPPPPSTKRSSDRIKSEKDKPSKSWSTNKTLPLPMLSSLSSNHDKDADKSRPKRSSSRTRSKASSVSTVRPEQYPLPPSRAATWTGEQSHGDQHGRGDKAQQGRGGDRDRDRAESFVSARSGLNESKRRMPLPSPGQDRDANNTVIGKMRDLRGLKIREGEVRPEDSVSQVG